MRAMCLYLDSKKNSEKIAGAAKLIVINKCFSKKGKSKPKVWQRVFGGLCYTIKIPMNVIDLFLN